MTHSSDHSLRLRFIVSLASVVAVAVACSDGTDAERPGLQTTGAGGAGAGTAGTSALGPGPVGMGGAGGILGVGGALINPMGGNGGTGGMRETKCDEMGNCTCINIGVMGRNGAYGAVPGMDSVAALEAWLNAKSSAVVDTHVVEPQITTEFLAKYDVLILQAMEAAEGMGAWAFDATELAAFEAWVRAGGGVIALTGYGAQPLEAITTNTLLQFSGLQYAGLTGAGDTMVGQAACPDTCCYCLGNSIPSGGWNPLHPISANMTAVGAFYGRSIAPGAGETVASTAAGVILGGAAQVDAGRVFMFHDEWVTYTSQWDGSGIEFNCMTNGDATCATVHPSITYQVAQFWYNSILWASGDRECFDIDEPEILK